MSVNTRLCDVMTLHYAMMLRYIVIIKKNDIIKISDSYCSTGQFLEKSLVEYTIRRCPTDTNKVLFLFPISLS